MPGPKKIGIIIVQIIKKKKIKKEKYGVNFFRIFTVF